MKKILSIIIVIILAAQTTVIARPPTTRHCEAAYGGRSNLSSPDALAVKAAAAKKLTPDYIRNLRFESEVITDGVEVVNLRHGLTQAMILGGFELMIGKTDIQSDLSAEECFKFSAGRIEVVYFKVVRGKSIDSWPSYLPEFVHYIFAITNKQGVIGHGSMGYTVDSKKQCTFRYSIHGARSIIPSYDFTRKGYGRETLSLMMAVAVNGGLFDGEVREFRYPAPLEDVLSNPDGLKKMATLLVSAGFSSHPELTFNMMEPGHNPIPRPRRISPRLTLTPRSAS